MNTTHETREESKNATIKTFAIIGFVVVAVLGLWLAVQVVRFVPTAFSTLASVVDGVGESDETFVVSTDRNIVNSGEAVRVMWTELKDDGAYTFSYQCIEGVTVETRNGDGDIIPLACDTDTSVAAGDYAIDVIVSAENRRFTDVPFSVNFLPEDERAPTLGQNGLVTVVNATVSQSDELADENEDGNTETESTDTTGGVTQVPTTVTTIPASDPNGFTDLAITYLGVGSLSDNDVFTPRANLDNDLRGAVRFEVKNIGTKTSGFWTFKAELPTAQGFTYDSSLQDALKPNERSVITLGFDTLATPGSRRISASVAGVGDQNLSNNAFNWSVQIVE